jgi:hypothetical protein
MTYPGIREMEIEIDTIALFRKSLGLRQCICQIVLSRLRIDPDSASHLASVSLSLKASRMNGYIPQSHSIHTAITENILSRSCSITASSIFVGNIAQFEDM